MLSRSTSRATEPRNSPRIMFCSRDPITIESAPYSFAASRMSLDTSPAARKSITTSRPAVRRGAARAFSHSSRTSLCPYPAPCP
ncbi:MAG: hypothetical protein Q8L84_08935 [Hyphomonas sp.]|nr:hypothetical protein [Hyphomonas sp.]